MTGRGTITRLALDGNNLSLSAPGGGEGRGEVGGAAVPVRGIAHLTLPVAAATGPPPEGGEGKVSRVGEGNSSQP